MKVWLIAGEPSGDRLGAALMAGLRQLVPEVRFEGIGGQEMAKQGLTSRFPMKELSVMGLLEVLPKYFHLKRRIRECAEAILAEKPDVVVTIDSPDFCLRVAKLVKAKSSQKIVHYVAPSVWAWRPKRAERMKGVVDHVLALLPFEPPYLERAGVPCSFVGHPVTTETAPSDDAVQAFRARLTGPVVLLLPGSRKSEVTRLLPRFQATLALLDPNLTALLPIAPGVEAEVRALITDPRIRTIDPSSPDKTLAFRAADVALAASGTVSLELAAARTPMVIGYDMNRLTYRIMKRMLLTDTVTLVNLVAESRAVKEFIGPDCQPEPMAKALQALLTETAARAAQIAAMDLTMERLGAGGEPPGLRAARVVVQIAA
jgi:lipid-A-disaccharide synthase